MVPEVRLSYFYTNILRLLYTARLRGACQPITHSDGPRMAPSAWRVSSAVRYQKDAQPFEASIKVPLLLAQRSETLSVIIGRC